MKRMRSLSACLRAALAKIHLVDKCLMVFMLVLLMQSSYTLFADHGPNNETNQIDVIVRTSTAGIFGYFLSANFIRHESGSKSEQSKPSKSVTGQSEGVLNRIGFAAPDAPPEPGGISTENADKPPSGTAGVLQILVAAGIGMFCLLVLTVFRNVPILSQTVTDAPSVQATVAQFRDIVSGCVGFLIGCPTSSSAK